LEEVQIDTDALVAEFSNEMEGYLDTELVQIEAKPAVTKLHSADIHGFVDAEIIQDDYIDISEAIMNAAMPKAA